MNIFDKIEVEYGVPLKAGQALRYLVGAAMEGATVSYTDIAKRVGHNVRHFGAALEIIGKAIEIANHKNKNKFKNARAITSLVVRKDSELPTNVYDKEFYAISRKNFYDEKMPKVEKKKALNDIQTYLKSQTYWMQLLLELDLEGPLFMESWLVDKRSNSLGRGGESLFHLKLKHFVAQNPKLIGVKSKVIADTEAMLSSGDKIDVHFHSDKQRYCVEVKSGISGAVDIQRGMMQCLKYYHVSRFEEADNNRDRKVQCILVISNTIDSYNDDSLNRIKSKLKKEIGLIVIEDFKMQS